MRLTRLLAALSPIAVATALLASTATADAGGAAGFVYTLTNGAAGNAVTAFARAGDGTLTPAGTFPTGGLGTGSGLDTQGALVLDHEGHRLFAVDAGSNEISSFRVDAQGLTLVSTIPSGGVRPVSLTVHGNLLYVVNQGSSGSPPNIAGFEVAHDGSLAPLAGSTLPLSAPFAFLGPAQIGFSPDGAILVVTEKVTNLIDTYVVGSDGVAAGPLTQPAAARGPFGFDFDKRGHLVVSYSVPSALSSYDVSGSGVLSTITALAEDGQRAACWVVVTKNGRFAYTTNTGSDNVSSYSIGHDGTLTLLAGAAAATGDGPIDMDVSVNSRYLYVLDGHSHGISSFDISGDGSLAPLEVVGGLPAGATGLAVR